MVNISENIKIGELRNRLETLKLLKR